MLGGETALQLLKKTIAPTAVFADWKNMLQDRGFGYYVSLLGRTYN